MGEFLEKKTLGNATLIMTKSYKHTNQTKNIFASLSGRYSIYGKQWNVTILHVKNNCLRSVRSNVQKVQGHINKTEQLTGTKPNPLCASQQLKT
jgi:hypothetical protein